ncbi:OmpP1/FadL family transporter [Acinetobacter sp.]|uniref:OmpP1/FadL family transporter n=1 Tax=Acinetobacter sp. TaxID=472 RepID=UPI00388ECA06
MLLKKLPVALCLVGLPLTSFAAALDRSGQSIAGFLQPNNYFEAGISVLDPNVSGQDVAGNPTGDMAGDYYFPHAVLKLQATEQLSIGLIYDQPFGADAEYRGRNNFVSTTSDTILPATSLTNNLPVVTGQPNALAPDGITPLQVDSNGRPIAIALDNATTGGTSVEVKTQNLNLLVGYQPNPNWNFYGGLVYQTLEADVNLRGNAYSLFNGYALDVPEDSALGWLAGFAYQIPEIALKASLTYRSEIEHEFTAREDLPLVGNVGQLLIAQKVLDANTLNQLNAPGKSKVTTPQSVNLDLQTGIMADTVAFANVRWVNWEDFYMRPHQFGKLSELAGGLLPSLGKPDGFNLVDYAKDQWSANVGVGRKMNDKWAGNVSVGWDSGAGNPVTTLGPTEGFWNLGLGVQYSPTPSSFIAGGVKYLWLGDAKAQTGAHSAAGNFTDNDAMAYGLRIGQRF